ncbi:hypothetical protein [Bradyrhizobium sp.]|uniref:hypothetical protein n=1 Tax=Bradyrhizobium sp. TaxID=376 RepID=UPI003C3AC1A5
MTVEEAQRALMTPLKPLDIPFSEECWMTQRADGKDPAISYEVQKGKIVVIYVVPNPRKQETTNVTDTRGIGIGAMESDIRRAYGQVKIAFAPYFSKESEIEAAKVRARLGVKSSEPVPSPQYTVEVESPDHQRAIIFTTQDSKVIDLATGFKPAVGEMEACS